MPQILGKGKTPERLSSRLARFGLEILIHCQIFHFAHKRRSNVHTILRFVRGKASHQDVFNAQILCIKCIRLLSHQKLVLGFSRHAGCKPAGDREVSDDAPCRVYHFADLNQQHRESRKCCCVTT